MFYRFYNQFLIRKRWDVPYSRTAQMLKETCNCDDKRIGKERISVFVVKQFDKKEWGYKCNDTPMCNLCDKKLCRERKFGIGEEIVFPALTDLQKIKLEKPYYYLNVDGERLHLENVKFLKQQSLFQEACMEQLDFKPPTVKPKDWDMIINPLMKNHEPIDPPEGVTTQDQLQNHLEEYCLNRQVSTDKNDLKKGGVWTNEGNHHFVFDRFYNQFLIPEFSIFILSGLFSQSSTVWIGLTSTKIFLSFPIIKKSGIQLFSPSISGSYTMFHPILFIKRYHFPSNLLLNCILSVSCFIAFIKIYPLVLILFDCIHLLFYQTV